MKVALIALLSASSIAVALILLRPSPTGDAPPEPIAAAIEEPPVNLDGLDQPPPELETPKPRRAPPTIDRLLYGGKLQEVISAAELLATEGDPQAAALWAAYHLADGPDRRDFKAARAFLAHAAERGDTTSLIALADLLRKGLGGPKDPEAAFLALQQARDLGDPAASIALGEYYEKGIGAPVDIAAARALYQDAADAGQASAYTRLGKLHERGLGAEPSYAEASALYEKAAALGDSEAKYYLGVYQLKGLGQEIDKDAAYRIIQDAANAGNAAAMMALAFPPKDDREIAKAYRTKDYLFLAIAKGDPDALFRGSKVLSKFRETGRPISDRYSNFDSFELLLQAVEREHPPAIKELADKLSATAAASTPEERENLRALMETHLALGKYSLADKLALSYLSEPGLPREDAEKLALSTLESVGKHINAIKAIEWNRDLDMPLEEAIQTAYKSEYADLANDSLQRDQGDLDQPMKVLSTAKPAYPDALKMMKESGQVEVEFVVGKDGSITSSKIINSTHPAFEQPALDSINKWTFQPAIKDGKALNVRSRIKIGFNPD